METRKVIMLHFISDFGVYYFAWGTYYHFCTLCCYKFVFSRLIVYAFGTCLQTFPTDINVLCIFSVLGSLRFGECFSCLTLSLISGFKVFSRLIWIIGFHMVCYILPWMSDVCILCHFFPWKMWEFYLLIIATNYLNT